MKKSMVILLMVMLVSISSLGQNLILNGSFEDTIACPVATGQIEYCLNWSRATFGSPDFLHPCSGATGVPDNPFGNQIPHHGNAYAGLAVGSPSIEIREYIISPITSPLLANSCYHFEMFVSLGNRNTTTDDVQVYFSDTMYQDLSNFYTIPVTPHIINPPGNMFDTLNWTLVSGDYMAHGGESYIIIGNFNTSANSTYDTIYSVFNPTLGTYLYIDNISLTLSTCTSLNEIMSNINFNIYPNPTDEIINFNIDSELSFEFELFNMVSKKVLSSTVYNGKKIKIQDISAGLYYYTLKDDDGRYLGGNKIIIY